MDRDGEEGGGSRFRAVLLPKRQTNDLSTRVHAITV